MKKTLLILCFLFFKHLIAQVPTLGLLGHYPFNGNANDASGNAQHGTVNGAALTTDRFGNANSAYSFNGSSDYISLPAGTYTNLNVYSYSCWIKQTSASVGFAMCFGESSYGYCQALLIQATGSVTGTSYNSGSNPTQSLIHTTATYSINQWLHVVLTRDFTAIKVYVNGVLFSSSSAGTGGQNASYYSSTTNWPVKAYIGARTTSVNYFTGSIDDVRIYSNVLSQSDINALYNENCFQNTTNSTYTLCSGNAISISATPAPSNTVMWYSSLSSTSSIASGTLYTTVALSAGTYTYYAAASTCTLINQRLPITVSVNPTPTISVSNGTICSGNSFLISPTGAASYSYSNGSTVTPGVTSTYTVVGQNPSGCISSVENLTVTVNTTPTISINSGFVCSGQSFTLTPGGATSYVYSGGSSIVSPTANTSYTVTGTSVNGCSASAVANVGVVASPTLTVINPGNVCIGNSATLSVSGANFYTWNSGATTTAIVVSPSVTTSYTVSGVNLFGCLNSTTTTLNVNPYPIISVNSGSICLSKSFTLSPSGAATYTFSGGSNIVSPLVNTNYFVTGTSAQGCISSNVAVSSVTVASTPTLTVNSGSICSGKSFTLIPAGGISYTYSGGSAVVSPPVTSNYTITGSGANGCTSSTISTITVNALPSVSITGSTAICNGNPANLIANGAVSYTWNTGANTNSILVSPPSTTNYSVAGTDVNGCINQSSLQLTVNPQPIISVNSGSICLGKTFTIVPVGASTYTYSGGSNLVSPASLANYSITGTSAQGCISSNTAISTVSVISLPLVSVNSGTICSGSVFSMTPSGALSYSYSNGSATIAPAVSGTYTVTGSNAQGCISPPAISNISVTALPIVTANSGTICAGGSFSIVPSGASTYTITGGSMVVNPAVTTTYTLLGTNPAGCISSPFLSTVTVNSLPVISVNSGTVCAGNIFTMVPSGASSYTFSNGTNTAMPLTNSSYTITGMSAQGCPSSNSVISSVTVIALPILSVNSGSICDGEAFIMTPGGASSYTFSSGSSIVFPASTSSYTVVGTGPGGCISSPVVSSVTVHPAPVISVNGSSNICNGALTVLTASGASSYTWSNGPQTSTSSVSPTSNTTYTVLGSNAFGCVSAATHTLIVNPIPIITSVNGTICAGNSYVIPATGASTYTFSGGSATVSPASNTVYTITGTSAAGCISANTATVSISVNALPNISIVATNTICEGQTSTLAASGALSYTWGTGSSGSTLAVTPSVTNTYSIAGTDVNGCTSSASVQITVNSLPSITVNSGAICPGNSFTLNPSGAITYTYSGGSNIVSPASSATYTVMGTDANGCVSALPAIANISVVNTLTVSISGNNTICAGETLILQANGASTYLWGDGTTSTNTILVSPVLTTSYTVMGISGTCSNTAVTSVSVNPAPLITINSGSICAGNTFILTPVGGITYTFSSGSATVTPTVTSSYTVTGSDVNGCSSSNTSTITVFALPQINVISSSPNELCVGETAVLAASGASSYTWNVGSNSNNITVSPLVTTIYTVTGADNNGCINQTIIVQNVGTCTGVKKLPTVSDNFLLFPNPNSGNFYINSPSENVSSVLIETVEGKLLFSYKVHGKQVEINNSEITPGIYFCTLLSNNTIIGRKKLIITN